MKQIRIALAVLLTAILICLLIAGCGKKDSDSTTLPDGTETSQTTGSTTGEQPDDTTAPPPETTDRPGTSQPDDTTEPGGTTVPDDTGTSGTPVEPEEPVLSLEGATFTQDTFVYDGTEKELLLTGLPEDATAVYSGNRQTDAGVYTVTVTVSAPGFRDAVCTGTLTILPAEVSVADVCWDYDGPYSYTGAAQQVSLLHLPNGVMVRYEGDIASQPGTYTAHAELTAPKNYALTDMPEGGFVLSWSILPVLTFDGNGGAGTDPDELTPEDGDTVVLPENPYLFPGRTFLGWMWEQDGVVRLAAPGTSLSVPEDICFGTVSAAWAELDGNVSFLEGDGGMNRSDYPEGTQYIVSDGVLTFTKNGTAKDAYFQYYTGIPSENALFGFTLHVTDGSCAPFDLRMLGSSASSCYTFCYTDKNGNLYLNLAQYSGSSSVLLAEFDGTQSYRLLFSFNMAQHTVDAYVNGILVAEDLPYTGTVEYSEVRRYNWYVKAVNTGSIAISDVIYGTGILPFSKEDREYSLLFDANGGTGSMSSLVYEPGGFVTVPGCAFTRDGFSFTGWAVSPGGTAVYYPGEQILPESKTIQLFAVWRWKNDPVNYAENDFSASVGDLYYLKNRVMTLSCSDGVLLVGKESGRYSFIRQLFSPEAPFYALELRLIPGQTLLPGSLCLTDAADHTAVLLSWDSTGALCLAGQQSPAAVLDEPTDLALLVDAAAGYAKLYLDGTFVTLSYFADDLSSFAVTGLTFLFDEEAAGTVSLDNWRVYTDSSVSCDPVTGGVILYDANGGSGYVPRTDFTIGTPCVLPENLFTHEHATFAGWSLTQRGFADYQPGDSITLGETTTLYAVWEWPADAEYTYTEDFSSGSGKFQLGNANGTMAYSTEEGMLSVLKAAGGNGFFQYPTKADAPCILVEFSIQAIPETALPDSFLRLIGSTTNNTCVFFGTNSAGELLACNNSAYVIGRVSEDTPIQLAFYIDLFHKTVSVWADGAMVYRNLPVSAGLDESTLARVNWYFDTSVQGGFILDDFRFGTGRRPSSVSEDLLRVTFDPNGGSGAMSGIGIAPGAVAPLPACTYTWQGRRFVGWSLSRTGEVAVADGGMFTMEEEALTLYAVWEDITTHGNAILSNAKGGADGILTLVHDDGTLDTMNYVTSQLRKYEEAGTLIRMSIAMIVNQIWNPTSQTVTNQTLVDNWQTLLDTGFFEMVNHSMSHSHYGVDENDIEKLTQEIITSGEVLRQLFPGEDVLSFVYPGFNANADGIRYSQYSKDLIMEHYIAARGLTNTTAINTIGATDYSYLLAIGCTTDNYDTVISHIDEAADARKWAVVFFHVIKEDKDADGLMVGKTYFNNMLAHAASLAAENRLWCATLDEAALYTREYETATLETSVGENSITLRLTDEMDDAVYNFPLTVKVWLDPSWESVTMTQNGSVQELTVLHDQESGGNYVYADVIPDGNDATLTPAG